MKKNLLMYTLFYYIYKLENLTLKTVLYKVLKKNSISLQSEV